MAKEKFLEEPVLVMPDPVKPFILETNMSNWAAGAVVTFIYIPWGVSRWG